MANQSNIYKIEQFDQMISEKIYKTRYHKMKFSKIFDYCTRLYGLPLLLLGFISLGNLSFKPLVAIFGSATILGLITDFGIKRIFKRQRPQYKDGKQKGALSFPSTHAVIVSYIFTVYTFAAEPRSLIMTALIAIYGILILAHRVLDGYHYLFDILGGIIIGGIIGIIVLLIL